MILDRRPKAAEAAEEEQQLCCFGDRTRVTTDDALAARPGSGDARLLLRLLLRAAAEAPGCACAGENVARDAILFKKVKKTKEFVFLIGENV